jgi:amidohydrolase
MSINEKIMTEALSVEQYVINARRTVHTYAEIGGTEVKTSAFIRAELDKMGIPHVTVGDTGLLATLDTGKPGPGIALRADIDALPIRENPNNLSGYRSCLSENENTCHACGHDAHTAMLLGSARVLCKLKDALCGTVYFCFEEGEENGRGFKPMINALRERQVDAVWAIHVDATMESGKISVDPGPRMAGGAHIKILVKGKGGHGSRPDHAVNPVFAAASIVTNIPGAFVNQLNAGKTVTFGITTIQGGGISNVFSDTASILGSLRFFDAEEGAKAAEIVKSVAEHTAAMHKCTVEFDPIMRLLGEPVINDAAYAERAQAALKEILPIGSVEHCDPWYGSESFSCYLKEYPGVMAFLGIKNPAAGTGAAHHNEYFDVDENVLKTGVIATVKFAAACINASAGRSI